jgi:hypothetical protein
MSTTLLPTSLLESIGLQAIQQAADAAFGPGKLIIGDDGTGVNLGLPLSASQTLHIEELSFTGGLNGRIYIDGLAANPLQATLFDGFNVALTAFDLTFAQSGLAASHVAGSLTIPFFTNSSGQPNTVDIEVSTKSDGSINISVAAQQSSQSTTPDGLIQLFCPLPSAGGSVEIDVASLEIDKAADGAWAIILSGNLIVTTPVLNFPTIALQGLGIDTQGHVSLKGGWIDLPSQLALDFFGFHIGLQKLGFGNDPTTGRWIGFNGDISLVEGISLGGSVRGLRINLGDGSVSLDGVTISFELPDVLSINGEVDHIQVSVTSPQALSNAGLNPGLYNTLQGLTINVFAGQVKLVIEAAGDLEIDAGFIAGTFDGKFGSQTVFFLDLDVELPVGIPLFLDVSLWGIQGLVATGLEPHPEPTHTWWDWYKFTNQQSGATDYSATEVQKWLSPQQGAFAIGGGVTIGTEFDDGFTVSAAIMLVIMMPGPVISLIGKANILSKRIGGASEEANFEAMATYDGNAETFDLVIQAQYSIPVVLDISATAEFYVGGGDWFFAMGKPPREQRVSARIFDIFETDAYFIVSDQGLVTGTWTGYQNSWSFGPLSASLDAYLATLAAIQWSPFQLAAGIQLYGNVHLSAFGIGIGITADALLEGTAPSPFYIYGQLSLELDLPWPLPNVGGTVTLSWGGDDGSVPPAPLALGHVDATLVDHCDANSKPTSDHYTLLAHRPLSPQPPLPPVDPIQPDIVNGSPLAYDTLDKPGILNLTGQSLTDWAPRKLNPGTFAGFIPDGTSPGQMAPVVPQDAHLTLSFSHPTQDSTNFFSAAIPYGPDFPAEVVTPVVPTGNPLLLPDDMSDINPNPPTVNFTIRHSLTEVALYQYDGSSAWDLLYTTANPVTAAVGGPTVFTGVWLQGDPATTGKKSKMTQLKVIPYSLVTAPDGKTTTKRAILPKAPAIYALRAVTRVEAARASISPSYQTVSDGYPIVEYTYFQTVSGPGTADGIPSATPRPVPSGTIPYLALAQRCGLQQQPASAFPIAGSLADLATYTLWSWPPDGATTAYYGYDVSVEFVETYVNELYAQFDGGGQNGLHFRCVDRNNGYTAVIPDAAEVPSVPANSALVAAVFVPQLPATIAPPINILPNPVRFPVLNPTLLNIATQRTPSAAPSTPSSSPVKSSETDSAPKTSAAALSPTDTGIANMVAINPIFPIKPVVPIVPVNPIKPIVPIVPIFPIEPIKPVVPIQPIAPIKPIIPVIPDPILQPQEDAAAAQARSLWFRPFFPQTQYTLDVVAGSILRVSDSINAVAILPLGSIQAIFNAKDAIAALAALNAFYKYEDSLTTLKRFTFATSRYSTFAAQMANVTSQLSAAAGATPVRNYVAPIDPVTWFQNSNPLVNNFATALSSYTSDRAKLASVAAALDPLADALQLPGTPSGNAELVAQRLKVATDWTAVSQASNAAFDALISALGHPELASGKPPVLVPDTELSLFLDSNKSTVLIMLESPEPLPWQRIWRGITITNPNADPTLLVPLWSADGTRGLLVVSKASHGGSGFTIRFSGNIGAEAPCIMLLGAPVAEVVAVGTVPMGPNVLPGNPAPIQLQPVFGQIHQLMQA